jgi:hypothetical protein
MDIVIDYGKQQFIIELKLWHGEASLEDALEQLTGYLKSKDAKEGYLITFDFRKKRSPGETWRENEGCRVFDVVL